MLRGFVDDGNDVGEGVSTDVTEIAEETQSSVVDVVVVVVVNAAVFGRRAAVAQRNVLLSVTLQWNGEGCEDSVDRRGRKWVIRGGRVIGLPIFRRPICIEQSQ